METIQAVAVLLVSFACVSTGPQKPNLTGTWVVVTPAAASGQEYRLKHDDTSFTRAVDAGVVGDGRRGGYSFTYLLDGKERRLAVSSSYGEDNATLATATWKENRIVIIEKTPYPDGRVLRVTQRWGLNESGQLIVTFLHEVDGKRTEMTLTAKRKE